jgi:hypothetical protein
LVSQIAKDLCLITVQQAVALGDVRHMARGASHGVYQSRMGVHTGVRFHAEIPLAASLARVHLRVSRLVLVLRGAGCGNQGRIDPLYPLSPAALEQ